MCTCVVPDDAIEMDYDIDDNDDLGDAALEALDAAEQDVKPDSIKQGKVSNCLIVVHLKWRMNKKK